MKFKNAEQMRIYREDNFSAKHLSPIDAFFVKRRLKTVMRELEAAAKEGQYEIIRKSLNKHVEQILKNNGYGVFFTSYDHTYLITFRKNGFKPPDIRGMKI